MSRKKFDCSEMHERQKDLVYCLWCKAKIGLTYEEKLKNKVDSIPLEVKQKVLDLVHDCKTIGEIKEIVGLDTIEVGEIIMRNMEDVHFIRKDARA